MGYFSVSSAVGLKSLKKVTADGEKTFTTLLDELYSVFTSVESYEHNPNIVLRIGTDLFHHFGSGQFTLFVGVPANSRFMINAVRLQSTSTYYRYLGTAGANTITQTDMSSTVVQSGIELELLYSN